MALVQLVTVKNSERRMLPNFHRKSFNATLTMPNPFPRKTLEHARFCYVFFSPTCLWKDANCFSCHLHRHQRHVVTLKRAVACISCGANSVFPVWVVLGVCIRMCGQILGRWFSVMFKCNRIATQICCDCLLLGKINVTPDYSKLDHSETVAAVLRLATN